MSMLAVTCWISPFAGADRIAFRYGNELPGRSRTRHLSEMSR